MSRRARSAVRRVVLYFVVLFAGGCSDAGSASSPPGLGVLTLERVSTWKGDAQAAYTISHDDACEPSTSGLFTYADPELRQRGLTAAFGAIVASCARFDQWQSLNGLLDGGHEIMNHSWGHKDLVTETRDFTQEVQVAKATLDAQLSTATEFFIFPYDSFDDAALRAVEDSGHVGARAGARGVNGTEVDERAVRFDVYGPEFSIYATDPVKSQDILNALVDEAVASGGWALRELHGVEDASWQAVPLAEYRRHLDYIAELVSKRALWVAGPAEVIKYRRAFRACGVPALADNELWFPNASPECSATRAQLSVVLRLAGSESLAARQAGRVLTIAPLSQGTFVVDVWPGAGRVELSAN